MKLFALWIGSLMSIALIGSMAAAQDDWPQWRGPARTGVADSKQKPPTQWSDSQNVVWKAAIPGRGHGAPTVVGGKIFLQTADEEQQVQSVLCFDRATGKQLWKTDVHTGKFVTAGINKRSTQASSTPACDGERVIVNFPNDAAIRTTALDLNGKQVWQTKVSDYVLHQGYGSSPMLHQQLALVAADNKGGGAIAGLDRSSGKIVWKQERAKLPNYPTPIVLTAAGKEQLFMIGCDVVASFDPLTGNKNWEHPGSTTECVTSTVTDGELIITSGGYPRNHVAAMKADGSGKIVWDNGTRVYVPSMLIKDGYLYAVADAGIAMCWEVKTGKEMWKSRLGGNFSSSPILVGDVIYATSETGETTLFRASPKEFESLGTSKLGDEVFSTPAICGGRIYHRVAQTVGGKRQEMLYCLGAK